MKKLPPSLTTVTVLSKTLALAVCVVFPFIGFWLGTQYGVPQVTLLYTTCVPPIATSTTTTLQKKTEKPVIPPNAPSSDVSCGISNCHGLDISCGHAVDLVCTALYQLGDFCRQYAQCGNVEGSCQQIQNPRFDTCVSCVKTCTQADPSDAFMCEEECRNTLSKM